MKVKELIAELESLKDELKDCEIKVYSQNGLLQRPCCKFELKDPMNIWDKSKDNVNLIVL